MLAVNQPEGLLMRLRTGKAAAIIVRQGLTPQRSSEQVMHWTGINC
jgi:hypothetical protein